MVVINQRYLCVAILSQMTKERSHAFLTAVGIVTTITVIMTSTIVTPVFAIKYFFNCID
jgi:hypothetical protein